MLATTCACRMRAPATQRARTHKAPRPSHSQMSMFTTSQRAHLESYRGAQVMGKRRERDTHKRLRLHERAWLLRMHARVQRKRCVHVHAVACEQLTRARVHVPSDTMQPAHVLSAVSTSTCPRYEYNVLTHIPATTRAQQPMRTCDSTRARTHRARRAHLSPSSLRCMACRLWCMYACT